MQRIFEHSQRNLFQPGRLSVILGLCFLEGLAFYLGAVVLCADNSEIAKIAGQPNAPRGFPLVFPVLILQAENMVVSMGSREIFVAKNLFCHFGRPSAAVVIVHGCGAQKGVPLRPNRGVGEQERLLRL